MALPENLVAAALDYHPLKKRAEWSQKSLKRTIDDWGTNHRDDYRYLTEHDEFDWMLVGWKVRLGDSLGRYGHVDTRTVEPEIEDQYLPDDDPRLNALTHRFGDDWVENLIAEVRRDQESTSLSEKEFVAYVMHSDPKCKEKQIADALDVKVGTIRGKIGRVKEKFEESRATVALAEVCEETEDTDKPVSYGADVETIARTDVEELPILDSQNHRLKF